MAAPIASGNGVSHSAQPADTSSLQDAVITGAGDALAVAGCPVRIDDPRPELLEDARAWQLLLRLSRLIEILDEPTVAMPDGLTGALHGLRCAGARLVYRPGQRPSTGTWRLEPRLDAARDVSLWTSEQEWQRDARAALTPHAALLRRLLAELPPPAPPPPPVRAAPPASVTGATGAPPGRWPARSPPPRVGPPGVPQRLPAGDDIGDDIGDDDEDTSTTMDTNTTETRNAAAWPGRALHGDEEWVTGRVAFANDAGLKLEGRGNWFNYGALAPGSPLRPVTPEVGDTVDVLVAKGRWINAIRTLAAGGDAAPSEPDDDGDAGGPR